MIPNNVLIGIIVVIVVCSIEFVLLLLALRRIRKLMRTIEVISALIDEMAIELRHNEVIGGTDV